MLYDPKWNQETKADPLSLDSFIAWLEKQPAGKPYCYFDTGRCLAAQYNESIGRDYVEHKGSAYMAHSAPRRASFDDHIELIALGLNNAEHTFGGALKRARKFAAKAY